MDWRSLRANRYSTDPSPDDWPAGVKPVSIDGVSLFGVHPATNELFWDRQRLVTEKRLASYERILATLATGATVALAVIEIGRSAGWWS